MNVCGNLSQVFSFSGYRIFLISITNRSSVPLFLKSINNLSWTRHDAGNNPLLTVIELKYDPIYISSGSSAPMTIGSADWLPGANLSLPGSGNPQPSTIVIMFNDDAKSLSWEITFINSSCRCTNSGCN